MGETTCKYKNAGNVHKFLEACPFNKIEEAEEGISWHELFVLYKMCRGKDMLEKPMSGAQERASLEKQLNAFKKYSKASLTCL